LAGLPVVPLTTKVALDPDIKEVPLNPGGNDPDESESDEMPLSSEAIIEAADENVVTADKLARSPAAVVKNGRLPAVIEE